MIVYCDKKSGVAAIREARATPVPVKVPEPLITAPATGERMALAPFAVRLPLTAKLLLNVSGWVTFESVRLLNVIAVPFEILCVPVPLKLNVLVPALRLVAGPAPPALRTKLPAILTVPVLPLNVPPTTAPGPIVRLPLTFIVVLFILKVPPATTTLVGFSELPALLVQVPPVVTSTSPPIVVFVPATFVADAVEILLPAVVAVFPVNVMLGDAPFKSKLAPAT